MEIGNLTKHLDFINNGRWVRKDEVPDLGDIEVKVRGLHSKDAQDLIRHQQRSGKMDPGQAVAYVIKEFCLLEVKNLTNNGKELTLDEIKGILDHESTEPLELLLLEAIKCVDQTRLSFEVKARKN